MIVLLTVLWSNQTKLLCGGDDRGTADSRSIWESPLYPQEVDGVSMPCLPLHGKENRFSH